MHSVGRSKIIERSVRHPSVGMDLRIIDDGLEVLGETECRELLTTVNIGRVAISIGAVPAVFPTHFVVDGVDIVLLTGDGLKLRAALDGTVVAFEADHIDDARRVGWSVLAIGRSSGSAEPHEVARARSLGVRPLAPGPRNRVVRIRVELLSGRRFEFPATSTAPVR